MTIWHNQIGKPLSSSSWLETHHLAKINERTEFAKSLVTTDTKRIVDLGCGIGLWLELLHKIAPKGCTLIGIDSDPMAIEQAMQRAKEWDRDVEFIVADLSTYPEKIPPADLFLAFNIFPFLPNPREVLKRIESIFQKGNRLVVRQYDGATLRFGPMAHEERLIIDSSLFTSVSCSDEFNHYDLDRIFEVINKSKLNKDISFETFQKTSPYDENFLKYCKETIDWTANYISEIALNKLRAWETNYLNKHQERHSYFIEVDLVVTLS